ncbi:MAG TPA: hypothetical protein VMD30_02610 [Tepidisphaeraceae bacterium]|nr:hypothetical protein [Tepidisphaeraceae bacterium]
MRFSRPPLNPLPLVRQSWATLRARLWTPSPAAALSSREWSSWLKAVDGKRRRLARRRPKIVEPHDHSLHLRLTAISFQLDGLPVPAPELSHALQHPVGPRAFRSRLCQRMRNHVAILSMIDRWLIRGFPLRVASVVRWYTSVNWGLATTSLMHATMDRLEAVVCRVNAPHAGMRSAVQEIAEIHCQLISDPLVPSFNGILSRLLLHYHLGRCGLPPIVFDPDADATVATSESQFLPRLLRLVDEAYSAVLAQ